MHRSTLEIIYNKKRTDVNWTNYKKQQKIENLNMDDL